MRKEVTLRHVAEAAGVSVATVSRILNGRPDTRVSASTSERVLQTAARLGYRANPIARALITGRRYMVCLSVPYLRYPFAPLIMHLMQQHLGAAGYGVAVEGAESGVERYVADMTSIEPQVDALIAIERPEYLEAYLAQRRSNRVVVVSAGASAMRTLDHVVVDLTHGSRAALRHLAASGRRRIVYVVPEVSHHPSEQREAAYLEFAHQVGLQPEFLVVPECSRAGARAATVKFVRERGLPDALFCCNDVTALGAYRGLLDLGARVPGDCAIVGCDGMEETAYLEVPLSTIVQPIEEMCRIAAQFALRRLDKPDVPLQSAKLTAQLHIRESSGG